MNKFSRIIVSSLFLCVSSLFADIERVSVTSIGEQGNNLSRYPSISSDGRFVAFKSSASNLVDSDTNGRDDMFVYDRISGATQRVNISSTGAQSDKNSFIITRRPVISDDGRFVSFGSDATNLVENGGPDGDVYVHDRESAVTEMVDIPTDGQRAIAGQTANPISSDGRFVTFVSAASNLVDGGTNGVFHVFIRDRELERTEVVSVSSFGEQGNGNSRSPSISADGRFVAFASQANNLIDDDTNGQGFGDYDIFVRDRQIGITERVNVSTDGVQVNGQSYSPSISADGRMVAFQSNASNLVANKTNGVTDVYVHDRGNGITAIVSVSSTGVRANNLSTSPSISADGRFVAFDSRASNLVDGDTNGQGFDDRDIFVHDRQTGITLRVSTSTNGAQSNGRSFEPSISADGHHIAFTSIATNLVEGDTNNAGDVFVVNNPLINSVNEIITIEKKINGELSIAGGTGALVTVLTGRHYRADYTVTNTSSSRIYGVRVFDEEQGSSQSACNLYALAPGQSTQCHRFYRALPGRNVVPARVEAKVSGEGALINGITPQVGYVAQDALSGGILVKHALNNKPGDDESSAVKLATNTDQSWLFEVTNASNIDIYKVKLYNDSVFPLNTGWEELCLIGKLKVGETRYCKRSMTSGQEGLNLMMGRVQGNDSYRVGFHQYINAANPTYYVSEP